VAADDASSQENPNPSRFLGMITSFIGYVITSASSVAILAALN